MKRVAPEIASSPSLHAPAADPCINVSILQPFQPSCRRLMKVPQSRRCRALECNCISTLSTIGKFQYKVDRIENHSTVPVVLSKTKTCWKFDTSRNPLQAPAQDPVHLRPSEEKHLARSSDTIGRVSAPNLEPHKLPQPEAENPRSLPNQKLTTRSRSYPPM